MNVSKFLSEGSYPNEDLVGVSGSTAWVLDGSSGFSDREFFDADSDGVWYVEKMDSRLRNNLSVDKPLKTVVRESITDVTEQIGERIQTDTVGDAPKRHELPVATLSMVRLTADYVEYLNICDSFVVISGDVERVISSPGLLEEIDRRTEEVYQETLEKTGSKDEARSAKYEYIRETRSYANTPGGYWAVQTNPLAATFAESGRVKRSKTESILLATDGVEEAIPNQFDSWKSLEMCIREYGVDHAGAVAREASNDDMGLAYITP